MERKKVLIIGAGIAGLSAGSYLARNGYDAELFEAHNKPGGVCTAWKKGKYSFDYCIHWLMGTRKDTGFDTIWDELGMLEDENGKPTEIVNFDRFTTIELPGGGMVRFFADADKLGEEFLRVAPEDRKMIRTFVRDLKELANAGFAVTSENRGVREKIHYYLSHAKPLLTLMKYVRMPYGKFVGSWKNPGLNEALQSLIPADWSAIALAYGMAQQHVKAAGYPVGGSLPLARNIERRLLAYGGKINYAARVDKIITSDGHATGIKLENGEVRYGDDVVSAADGYTTLFRMLEGRYLSPQLERVYREYPLFPSTIFAGFGVAKDLSGIPHALLLRLKEPLIIPDGSRHKYVAVRVYNFDPTLAPKGKTSVTAVINTWEAGFWRDLAEKDPGEYRKAKSWIADEMLKTLDEKFPGFSASVETIDVSTPYTVERYTANRNGSFEGFAPAPGTMMKSLPKEVPGLANCHMIGQWTTPGGGVPPAALDGRNLAIKLCRRDNRKFVAGIPE